MQKQTGTWLGTALNEKNNILTSPTHERYESYLCMTDNIFTSLKHPSLKGWDEKYAKKPANYNIYSLEDGLIPDIFNMVLAHTVFGQFQFLEPLARNAGVPLIRLEHTTSDHLDPKMVKESSKMFGDINVLIAEDQIKKWHLEDKNCIVIRHCVDEYFSSTKSPSERENVILSVANDFINRDVPLNYQLWKQLTYNKSFKVLGHTPGLSESAKDLSELRDAYRNSRIFLNTSRFSPIPSVLLEAAACGCAIVTTDTCAIPEYFTHGYDCLMSSNPKELEQYIQLLENDDDLANELGKNAQTTIKEKCNPSRFINEWDDLFKSLKLK